MGEWSSRHREAQEPGPQAWCVCSEKVNIADAREVTLPTVRRHAPQTNGLGIANGLSSGSGMLLRLLPGPGGPG
jgi:hypothetical protein